MLIPKVLSTQSIPIKGKNNFYIKQISVKVKVSGINKDLYLKLYQIYPYYLV